MQGALVIVAGLVAAGVVAAAAFRRAVDGVSRPTGRRRLRAASRALAAGCGAATVVLLLAAAVGAVPTTSLAAAATAAVAGVAGGLVGTQRLRWDPPGAAAWRWHRRRRALLAAVRDQDRGRVLDLGLQAGVDLLGGSAGIVAGPDGRVAALVGLGEPAATRALALAARAGVHRLSLGAEGRQAVAATVKGAHGSSLLVVIGDRLSPRFVRADVEALSRTGHLTGRLMAEAPAPAPLDRDAVVAALSSELEQPLDRLVRQAGRRTSARPHLHEVVERLADSRAGWRQAALTTGRPIDVSQVLRSAVAAMEHDGHHVDVPTGHLWAIVERATVEGIVSDLVANALDHTPAGTRVEVSAHHLDDHLLITVDDDGPGVPPRMRSQVFEPLVRAGPATGRLGLGLFLVHHLAREHGGWAWVEGRRPRGASFRVTLRSRAPASGGSEADRAGPTIDLRDGPPLDKARPSETPAGATVATRAPLRA